MCPEKKIAGGNRRRPGAFTLVELLVVIGIIAMLIGLLLPSARKAQQSAKSVSCKSNLKQISIMLVTYANNNRGYLFPIGPDHPVKGVPTTLGTGEPPWYRWPVYVFPELTRKPLPSPLPAKPAGGWEALPYEIDEQWSTKILICPVDEAPAGAHSYLLNQHLADHRVRFSTSLLRTAGKAASDVVLMGEKVTTATDYYLEVTRDPSTGEPLTTEFYNRVELYRHGPTYGSNYLYVDMHVDSMAPSESLHAFDPWDLPK